MRVNWRRTGAWFAGKRRKDSRNRRSADRFTQETRLKPGTAIDTVPMQAYDDRFLQATSGMTDRDQPSDPAAHKVADVLLPWFVNGTLEGDELAFVERHVRDCPQCQQEVGWLRELHAACVAAEDVPEASKAARGLRRKLDAPRTARSGIARWRLRWGSSSPEPRWAIAGALAAFVALGTVWFAGTEGPALYRTLGAHNATAPENGTLVVVFDPATTESDLRRIVRSAGARIVDGPMQTNAYVLDVPSARRDQALQTLRAERAVMLAERLDAGARR